MPVVSFKAAMNRRTPNARENRNAQDDTKTAVLPHLSGGLPVILLT